MKRATPFFVIVSIVFFLSSCDFFKDLFGETYTITITQAAGGTISVSPEQEEYSDGDNVTITATPDSGYEFASWGGDLEGTENPLTITVTGNLAVTAAFTEVDSLVPVFRKTVSELYAESEGELLKYWTDTYSYPSDDNDLYDSYERIGTAITTHLLAEFTRDSSGRLARYDKYSLQVTPRQLSNYCIYSYDTDDDKYSEMKIYNSTDVLISDYLYVYDSARRLTSESFYYSGTLDEQITYDYDSEGIQYGGTLYCSMNGEYRLTTLSDIEFDSAGNVIRRAYDYDGSSYNPCCVETLTYDDYGNMLSEMREIYNPDESKMYVDYKLVLTYEEYTPSP